MRIFHRQSESAFNIAELIVVIAIIGAAASMLMPSLARVQQRSKQTACMSNLRQIGISQASFKHDHNDSLPAAVSISEGGAAEYFFDRAGQMLPNAWNNQHRIYQSLRTYLGSPKILICPADTIHKPTNAFPRLTETNFSYFLLVTNERKSDTNEIWAADGITDEYWPRWQAFASTAEEEITLWFYHGEKQGNLLFADGRVEQIGRGKLRSVK
jgi:prepilin-type processing-associated H-X9-DG protein